MSLEEFRKQYEPDDSDEWKYHPKYTLKDWQYVVANNNTRLGYWEWAYTQWQSKEKQVCFELQFKSDGTYACVSPSWDNSWIPKEIFDNLMDRMHKEKGPYVIGRIVGIPYEPQSLQIVCFSRRELLE